MQTSGLFFALPALILGACSSSSSGNPVGATDGGTDASTAAPTDAAADSAPATGGCFTLPAGARKQGAGCTGVSGTFTEITLDTAANTYDEACSAPAPYKDQATFDANEGTSAAAGVTITSNEDYVVTATCASGSVEYTPSGGTKAKIVFLWTKVP
jgi:hypothetical protein